MLGTSTPHSADLNKLAQITGRQGPKYAQYVYAAAMTIYPQDGASVQVATTAPVGNATVNAGTMGRYGEVWEIEFANDSGGPRTITFGTGFRPSAPTVVGTANKSIIVGFMSNGTAWLEKYRSAAAV